MHTLSSSIRSERCKRESRNGCSSPILHLWWTLRMLLWKQIYGDDRSSSIRAFNNIPIDSRFMEQIVKQKSELFARNIVAISLKQWLVPMNFLSNVRHFDRLQLKENALSFQFQWIWIRRWKLWPWEPCFSLYVIESFQLTFVIDRIPHLLLGFRSFRSRPGSQKLITSGEKLCRRKGKMDS